MQSDQGPKLDTYPDPLHSNPDHGYNFLTTNTAPDGSDQTDKLTQQLKDKWSDDEHYRFLEALKYNRDWKKIQEYVRSKSLVQIRSHAQKYFLKMHKQGLQGEVPLSRPKKKQSHPYNPNAPRKPEDVIDVDPSSQTFLTQPEALAYTYLTNPGQLNQWIGLGLVSYGGLINAPQVTTEGCEELIKTLEDQMKKGKGSQMPELDEKKTPGLPDFNRIYTFLGALFDPVKFNHQEMFKGLGHQDKEVLKVLIHNLSLVLSSQQFQEDYNIHIQQELQKLQYIQQQQQQLHQQQQQMQSNMQKKGSQTMYSQNQPMYYPPIPSMNNPQMMYQQPVYMQQQGRNPYMGYQHIFQKGDEQIQRDFNSVGLYGKNALPVDDSDDEDLSDDEDDEDDSE